MWNSYNRLWIVNGEVDGGGVLYMPKSQTLRMLLPNDQSSRKVDANYP